MNSENIKCCNRKSSFSIVYSVAGDKKCYDVCSVCVNLDCFSKFIIEKTPIIKNILKNESKNSDSRTSK